MRILGAAAVTYKLQGNQGVVSDIHGAYEIKLPEGGVDLVLKIVVLGRACRNGAAIKNRQPIGQMYVKAEASLPRYDSHSH